MPGIVLVALLLVAIVLPNQAQNTTDQMKTVHVVKRNIDEAPLKTLDELIEEAKQDDKISTFTNEDDHITELDMKFTDEQWKEFKSQDNRVTAFKALRSLTKRWSNKILPYKILPKFSSSQIRTIQQSIRDWETYTCLDFKPRTTEANYVEIGVHTGCWSSVGMNKGKQDLSLGSGCVHKSVVIHELGHAIGLHHEQTRPDRDDYVKIMYSNIKSGKEHNFQKYTTSYINDQGIPYDYTSIMHYGKTAFSKSRSYNTIITTDPAYQNVIGTGNSLSFRDIKVVNLMYSCSIKCRSLKCPGEGFVGKDCKCWCPGNPVVDCGVKWQYRNTRNHYNYIDIANIANSNAIAFPFRVKACHDVHVGFYATSPKTAIYEIVIGRSRNMGSSIRRAQLRDDVVSNEGARLSCTGYRDFWISYWKGRILVGTGKLVGTNLYMWYTDPKPYAGINKLGISTGWGTSGDWYYTLTNQWQYKSTPNYYSYSNIADIAESGSMVFLFSVKACHDVHVGFYATAPKTNMYELVIGRNRNKASSIRRQRLSSYVVHSNGARLSCTRYRDFWISYWNGRILVGTGKEVGQYTFMRYYDPKPYPGINKIGISTGWGATGVWYYSFAG